MEQAPQDSKTIEVGEYCLLFVDMLNQKKELDRIRRLPINEQERGEFLISLQNSIGQVSAYRDLFDNFFRDCHEYKPPRDEGVPDQIYQQMVELVKIDIKRQVFSDTMIYFAPIWDGTVGNSIMTLHTLLSTCAATFINTLSVGMVCRGSINTGIAGEFFTGEVYGPALADAYYLESRIADYPRIVVGDQLYLFLENKVKLQGQDLENTHNKGMAESCIGLIGTDDDGVKILDYLGKEACKIFPYAQILSGRALDFAGRELTRFRQQGDSKLVRRYERLLAYLMSRIDQFWE